MPDEDGRVHGLHPREYEVWLDHPVSKWFRDYLNDYADFLRREHMADWESGSLLDQREEWMRLGRVQTLAEIAWQPFEDFTEFYERWLNAGKADPGVEGGIRQGSL